MNFFKLLSLMLLCFSSFSLFAKNTSESDDNRLCKKVYVSERDLLLHENRIYLNNENEYEELDAVYSDSDGLFVVIDKRVARTRGGESIGESISNICGNGHTVYHRRSDGGCGGCANWLCPFRCKCYSPIIY